MNFKKKALVKQENGNYFLDLNGQLIDINKVGWVSDFTKLINEFEERNYNEITKEHIERILKDNCCYVEVIEVRNMAKSWSGSALNSYTTEEPMYREELAIKDKKLIVHFYEEE